MCVFFKLVVIFIRDKVFLKYVLRSCFVKNKDVHYYLHVLIKLMVMILEPQIRTL